jgi:hypothetical protein
MFHYNLFSLLRCPTDASQDQRLQCCYYSPDEKNHDGEVWYLAAGLVPFYCLPIVSAEEVWGLSADLLGFVTLVWHPTPIVFCREWGT